MTGARARLLPDGDRLHLHHGPIDLIIGAEGGTDARQAAFAAAWHRFKTVLPELVEELAILRRPVGGGVVTGVVAQRMVRATAPHAQQAFVTPMAAVAGAVAEEILRAMCNATPLSRAYVNNGGDIALHLSPGASFVIAVAGPEGQDLARVSLTDADPVRGIASSGQRGRSLSFGIADSVTVLADTASAADAAATLIANDVDLPDHPAIERVRACDVQADTDLGTRLVVRHCGPLTVAEVDRALDHGAQTARRMADAGLILSAALFLRGRSVTVGNTNLCQVAAERERNRA